MGLAIFYRTAVVHPPGVRRRVWPGTIVALLFWALVSWAFGHYVRTIAHYAVYYGSLATVAVILLWLYSPASRCWWAPRSTRSSKASASRRSTDQLPRLSPSNQ